MKIATVGIFTAAALGSTVGLKGTTPPPDQPQGQPSPAPPAQQAAPHKNP